MSVTICNMLANPGMSRARAMAMPVAFGLFQGLMPVAGYFAGSLARSFIEAYAGIIALAILGFIGGKMIWDGLHDDASSEIEQARGNLGVAALLMQAVATSIDAFAVGVSLAASAEPIFLDAAIITLCTFALSAAMVALGRKAGTVIGSRAQVVGGVILVLIGLRAMFS